MRLIIFIILIFSSVVSASTTGKLIFNYDNVLVGDTIPAKIIFSVQGIEAKFESEDFLSKTINNSFYITDIKDHHISENNHDFYEAELLLTIIRSFEPTNEQIFVLKGLEIRLLVDKEVKVEKYTEKLPEGFFFLNTEYKIPLDPFIKIIILIIVLLIITIIIMVMIKKNKKKKEQLAFLKNFEEIKGKWANLLRSAKNRDEIEYIYSNIKEWGKLLTDTKLCEEYKRTANKHIYKKNWEELEINEMNKIHHELLRNFKNGI